MWKNQNQAYAHAPVLYINHISVRAMVHINLFAYEDDNVSKECTHRPFHEHRLAIVFLSSKHTIQHIVTYIQIGIFSVCKIERKIKRDRERDRDRQTDT